MFRSIKPRHALVLAGTFVAFALVGCQRPVGTVTGKVSYQGKTLKGGSIAFVSTEGRMSFAGTIKDDGTYEVPDVVGGSYKVCVDTAWLKSGGGATTNPMYTGYGAKKPSAPKQADPPKGAGPPPDAPEDHKATASSPMGMQAAKNQKKYVEIPSKYASPETTDLTFTFNGGSAPFDIDLK
jgi:hypothetical protein